MAPNAEGLSGAMEEGVVDVREVEGAKCFVLDTESMVRPRHVEKDVQYRLLRLENGLEAFLMSDPETDKSAAAVDVRVGYLSDPQDLPGLAHFTEHMLFYSSEKYPKEDEYSKFISEHGGFCNAFTSAEDTNYHFDVNSGDFAEALDRFAQFFVAPLISKDGVGREINAVNSENSKNLNSDVWRNMQLWRHLSKPDHAFHKFGTGSIDTLSRMPKEKGKDTHEEMLSFYSGNYSANLMKLAVYSRLPLDEIEHLVASKFSKVKTLNKAADVFPEDPFHPTDHQRLMVRAVPIRNVHAVDLQFLIPPEDEVYRYTPCHYLSHLIGHEGEGSILKLLKDLKWATSLSAGPSPESYSSHSLFLISIELTDEGNDHVEECCKIVFQYLELLRREGIQEWIFEELKNVGETKFHFRDKQSAGYYVREICSGMQVYDRSDLLLAIHQVPREFREDAIRAALDVMTVDRARVLWLSPAHKGKVSGVEPWYKTEYEAEPMSEALAGELRSCGLNERLRLPARNQFIPTNFDLVEPEEGFDRPRMVRKTESSEVWYKPDTRFKTPKGQVYLSLVMPESYATPEAAVCTNLLTKLLVDSMNEVTYYAEVAGLAYAVQSTTTGMQLIFSGYSHKLLVLAEEVLRRLLAYEPNEERFGVLKEQMQKDFENTKFDQPYQQAIYHTSILCLQKKWHIEEYLDVLSRLSFAEFQEFLGRLMRRVSTQSMFLGNPTEAQCVGFSEKLEEIFAEAGSRPTFGSQAPEKRVMELPAGAGRSYSRPVGNEDEENGAVNIVFQIGLDSPKRNVTLQLWVQIAERAAFHSLRSVEQIGYIVCVMGWDSHQVKNVYFILQSSTHHPVAIDASVEKFLVEFEKRLAEMPDQEFADQKQSLKQSKLEKLKNLAQEGKRYWKEIEEGTLSFRRQEVEVEELEGVTLAELREFHVRHFERGSKERRKLSVRIISGKTPKREDAGEGERIEDVYKFKRGLQTYSLI